MITIRQLSKRYGKRTVVRDVDLTVERGKVTGLVGPNGAGKSTIIRSILGLVRPDRGDIRIDGQPISLDGMYRRQIGYMPQRAALPENLTAYEILEMLEDTREQKLAKPELLHQLNLLGEMEKPIGTLSGGNRQKICALLAFAFNPTHYILDEPTAGLDPIAASTLKDLIHEEKLLGKTILITSHILSDLEELADHIVFLLDGHILFDGALEDLLDHTGERNLERAIALLMKGRPVCLENAR